MRCHRSERERTAKNKETIIGCCEAWVEKRISPLRAHDETVTASVVITFDDYPLSSGRIGRGSRLLLFAIVLDQASLE
jgi:hypothetical protein